VYLHFSKLSVSTGDFVKKGQKIGEVGTTGRSTGPHLHWGVNWYNNKIDPNSLLGFGF
jgi:murein DD-endopeptidase MepM/ murein hydrolase activator NlpD